jgi:hypothetical protein
MWHDGDLRDDYNRVSDQIRFWHTELALTSLHIALGQPENERGNRTVQNAWNAYEVILKCRSQIPLPEKEAAKLDARLALLKKRLQEFERTPAQQ